MVYAVNTTDYIHFLNVLNSCIMEKTIHIVLLEEKTQSKLQILSSLYIIMLLALVL